MTTLGCLSYLNMSSMERQKSTPIDKESSPVTVAHASPLEIIEILERILSFLDQTTLKFTAARVSHQWFLIAKPLFVRHLHLDPENKKTWENLPTKLLLADKVSIGRPRFSAIQALISSSSGSQGWNQMTAQLVQGLQTIDTLHKDQIRVKSLLLFMDTWFGPQAKILASFNPQGLLDLTLNLPQRGTPQVLLEDILEQCPNLLSLSIFANSVTPVVGLRRPVQVDAASSIALCSHRKLPLRTLHLFNLRISSPILMSYLPLLGELTDLRIHLSGALGEGRHPFFQTRDESRGFWGKLALYCSRMESIYFNYDAYYDCEISVELFPRLRALGFDCTGKTAGATLRRLTLGKGVVNRLTRLELLKGHRAASGAADPGRDRTLYRFLCASPQLLHLKAKSPAWLSLDALWDRDDPDGAIWACRGLRTLSMDIFTFDQDSRYPDGDHEVSRLVFGYLSRVCSRLQTLSLSFTFAKPRLFALESGLCLLTRMKNLERLEIQTKNWGLDLDNEPLQMNDLAWIQGNTCTDTAPAAVNTSESFSLLQDYRTDPRSSATCVDTSPNYRQQCLEKIQAKSLQKRNRASTSSLRYRTQQRQGNRYLTDNESVVPRVDGLDGMEYCGSLLDLEACLQAQLFRFQNPTGQGDGRGESIVNQGLNDHSVWPCLKQIVFKIKWDSLDRKEDRDIERLEQKLSIMKDLRPDITIQFK